MSDLSDITESIKARIFNLESSLREAGSAPSVAPEMMDAANALRLSEHIAKTDSIKSELITSYSQYSTGLEALVRETLQIQKDLSALLQKRRPAAKPRGSATKRRTAAKNTRRKSATKRRPAAKRKVTVRKKTAKRRPAAKNAKRKSVAKRRPASKRKAPARKKTAKRRAVPKRR